jgi:hypothetical protein
MVNAVCPRFLLPMLVGRGIIFIQHNPVKAAAAG